MSIKYGSLLYAYIFSFILFAIPIINLFLFGKLLTSKHNKFKYYHFNPNNKDFVQVEVRELNGIKYSFKSFILNVLIAIPYLAADIFLYVTLYNVLIKNIGTFL